MSAYINLDWNKRLLKLLDLLLKEGGETLLEIEKEKAQLMGIKEELDKIPLRGLKTSPICLLQWIFEKTFPRKIVRIENELSEVTKLELAVSFHLEYCTALRENISKSKMKQQDICESLRFLLESWFVFNFSNYHYRKFINFPSDVRIYEINKLISDSP